MGEEDVRRQAPNVFNMKLLGAEVRPVSSGSRTLRDAINDAMRDWMASVDNTHYITSESAIGLISIFNASLGMPVPSGTLAPDLLDLAEAPSSPGQPAIVALETGAQRWDGGTAPERRVHLPYVNADLSDLTSDAQIIMKRATDWAARRLASCSG